MCLFATQNLSFWTIKVPLLCGRSCPLSFPITLAVLIVQLDLGKSVAMTDDRR